ncbi:MAG: winged helix-turn-helix domain-containing protein [Acidobacteriota bacterium]|nr:winged helix-turn-helix domain-containing protein [Acidobacteriota bacterium]
MLVRSELLTGFRLGEWLVIPEDGSLRSHAGTHRLEPLAMELLVFLCSQVGRVVSKQNLVEAVWSGRHVSDETVKGTLHQLRKSLDDNPRRPRFIETLPKRGYRMLVQPERLASVEEGATTGSDLQDWYRKGRAALAGQPSAHSLKQAQLYFQRALQSSSANAEAFSGLAMTHVLMVSLGMGLGRELLPRAGAAARRALELDAKLAESHLALGVVHFVHEHNFLAADAEFREAIDHAPGDSLAHRWYARFLASQSRHEMAVQEARRAMEADPLSLSARRDLIETLTMAGRFGDAEAEAQRLSDIAPNFPEVQLGMSWVYFVQKKYPEALEAFTAGLAAMDISRSKRKQVERAYKRGGMPAIFSLWAKLLEHEAELGQKNQSDLLVLYALLGKKDRCFHLMESAYESRNPYLLFLPVSPFLASLRSDRRYGSFLKRLGFHPPH